MEDCPDQDVCWRWTAADDESSSAIGDPDTGSNGLETDQVAKPDPPLDSAQPHGDQAILHWLESAPEQSRNRLATQEKLFIACVLLALVVIGLIVALLV
jgi:hypothetical protein